MKGSKVRILDHFKKYHTLTSMEAFEEYGITRLSARIKDLRDLGYDIDCAMVEGKNRYNESVRYGVYRLVGKRAENN